MLSRIPLVKSVSLLSIQEPKRRSETNVTMILGTKVMVISWIWVTAWKTLMTSPTARLTEGSEDSR